MSTAEQIVIASTPPAEDPAYIAKMVAKADGQAAEAAPAAPTEEAPAAERPAWLPEKFKSVEDMAKAYAELEAKQSQGKAPEAAPEVKPEDAPKASEGEAEKALADKGLDLNEFSQEFSKAGTLSQESYDKLEKAGYPKTVVDQYIAGQQALASQYEADVKAVANGKFDEVAQWAAENLTDAEKAAYNKAIDSGDINQAKLAVAGITAKYEQAYPTEGKLLTANTGAVGAGDVYESKAQMVEDMKSPLYAKDPAFRAKVAAKLSRSNIL